MNDEKVKQCFFIVAKRQTKWQNNSPGGITATVKVLSVTKQRRVLNSNISVYK